MKKKLFFGRVKSRKLSITKESNFHKFLSKNKISSIKTNKKIILEIGIGMGENLLYLSKINRKKILIGVDPFKNGMVNVSDYCIKKKIKNIYLYPSVVEKFFKNYRKLRFEKIYILFPDPWPKKRHNKRRLINNVFIKNIIFFLKKNGKTFFSTDNVDYYNNVKNILKKFDNIKVKKTKKVVTIKTKFYMKALKNGNNINSLIFSKN